MAHFRTMLTSDNFMAADLWSDNAKAYVEIVVQIAAIKRGEVVGEKGRKKGMPFVTMTSAKTGKPIPKPLGLNATNCGTIAGIAGSPDMDKWIGLWVSLYVTKTDAGPGEKRDCIRIRPTAAKAPGAQPHKDTNTSGSGATQDAAAAELVEPGFDPTDVLQEDRNG